MVRVLEGCGGGGRIDGGWGGGLGTRNGCHELCSCEDEQRNAEGIWLLGLSGNCAELRGNEGTLSEKLRLGGFSLNPALSGAGWPVASCMGIPWWERDRNVAIPGGFAGSPGVWGLLGV